MFNAKIYKSWTDLKLLASNKKAEIQYTEDNKKYQVFIEDASIIYWTEIFKSLTNVEGIDETQNNVDKADFESNYKDTANKPIKPKSDDGKEITRAESRPLNTTTCFLGRADSATGIGDGKELRWDFATDDDEITPSGVNYKKKRIEFKFLDPVYIKEGALYFHNALPGSYLDLKIVCPNGYPYYDNDGNIQYATEDTVISHYVINHWLEGDCPMGDELNTESCSVEIPSIYKFWLEITVPSGDTESTGHISLELYRKRTVIL